MQGENTGDKLAVLPNANDVWQVQESRLFMDSFALGFRDIGFDSIGDFGEGACCFASVLREYLREYLWEKPFRGWRGGLTRA